MQLIWETRVLFTWTNGKELDQLIKENIDRVVCCADWVVAFPKAGVRKLPILGSDHAPLVSDTVMEREVSKTSFRYLDAWSRDPGCHKVIEDAW